MRTISRPRPQLGPEIAIACTALTVGALFLVSPVVAAIPLLLALAFAAIAWFGYDRIALGLVAGALALVSFNALRPVGGATFSDALFAVSFLLIVAWCLATDRPIKNLPSWLWASAGILFLAAALVEFFPAPPSQAALFFPGAVFNLQPGGEEAIALSNLGGLFRMELALLLVPFVIIQVGSSWTRIRHLADAWLLGTVVASLFGIVGYLGLLHIAALVGGNPAIGAARARGLSTHPNVYGVTAAMVLPLTAAFLPSAQGYRKAYYLASLLILPVAILVSGSRTAILGGVFGLGVLALTDPAARTALRRISMVAVLLILIGGLTTFKELPGVSRLSGESTAVQSDEQRKELYSRVITEIEHRPIVGHGFQYLRGSHNIYLQLMHSGGAIGLIGFLVFVVGISLTGLRTSRLTKRPLVRGLTASVLVWLLVDGLFEPAIFDRYLYVPVGLVLAAAVVFRMERPVLSGRKA